MTLLDKAEQDRQNFLNKKAVHKVYPDATIGLVNGKEAYISHKVNVDNYKDFELFKTSEFNQRVAHVPGRFYATVKRPNRPAIKIWSATTYKLTVGHLIDVANKQNTKALVKSIERILRIQESPKTNSTNIRKRQSPAYVPAKLPNPIN